MTTEISPPVQVTERIIFREGKRLYLRPMLKEDMGTLTVWINDPDVTQFLKASYPFTPEDEMDWFEKLRKERKGSDVIVAVVLKENDELLGTMGLHHIDHKNGLATTGSFLGNKKHWNKGYGTEAKMLLLEYAFNTLNLRKILSMVYDYNKRSKRCLEKCGYKEEGVQRQHVYRNGRFADCHMMAVFRKDFAPLWKAYKKAK